ncbi:MAG: S26 family signal peptidase [Candidatus Omnitrophica bacterium]|nr:S26 family signal peptidase [Candidatus Omnitrophota bacterium]
MKLDEAKTEYCVVPEEEFSLSGEAMTGLLQAVLDRRAPFKFKARGFSMSPFIKNGDVVTISPLINHSIGFGKSVVFIHPQTGKLVIHRVVGQKGSRYFIKGDSIADADGFVPKKNILGIVTRVEREARSVHFGLGPERFVIAFLSKGRFFSFIFWIWRTISSSIRNLML